MKESKIIGKFILKLRKENNLTQVELAKKMNVCRQAVSNWECGKATPDIGALDKMSLIFSVSVDELLAGKRFEKLEEKKTEIINDDNRFKKNKIKVGLFVFFFIVIGAFLFFHFVNLVSVYSISGKFGSIEVSNGVLVKTRKKIYFNLGEIITDKNILDLKIFYLNDDNREIRIFSCQDCKTATFIDFKGYNAYIDFDNLDNIINKVKLEINLGEEKVLVDLDFKKDYKSYKIPDKVVEVPQSNYYNLELKEKILNSFQEKDKGYFKNIKVNDEKVTASLVDDYLVIECKKGLINKFYTYNFLTDSLSYEETKDNNTDYNINLIVNVTHGECIKGSCQYYEEVYNNFNNLLKSLF